MNKLKSVSYVTLGTLFFVLGGIGIILPLLPTTPLWLLTVYFYGKGSPRFHAWFTASRLYAKYLQDFCETRAMTRRYKWTLLLLVDAMLLVPFFRFESLWLKGLVLVLIVTKHLYFHTQVRVIKKESLKLKRTPS